MSNSISNIHYAVSIDTGYTGADIPDIGLVSGKMNYITDGFDSTGSTFETGEEVTEAYSTAFLSLDGVKPSTQSIDIVTGGDYAFLGSMNIVISNIGEKHKDLLGTEGLYLVGAKLTLYVIIDGVFYSSWVGSISSYKITESEFTFIGSDSHTSDNETIMNKTYGYNDTAFVEVDSDNDATVQSQYIRAIYPTGSADTTPPENSFVPYGVSPTNDDSEAYASRKYYGGHTTYSYGLAAYSNLYTIALNGYNKTIKTGMYIKVSDSERYIKAEYVFTEEGHTCINIDSPIADLSAFSQFYGIGYTGYQTLDEVLDETKRASVEKLTIRVYEKGLHFDDTDGEYVTNDEGKFIGTTGDGDTVYLEGSKNSDGSVTITQSEYTDILKPVSTKYFVGSEAFMDELAAGSVTYMQDLQTSVPSVPNNNDISTDGFGFVTDNEENHCFVVEFSEDITGYTPYALVSGMLSDSQEVWEVVGNGGLLLDNPPTEDPLFPSELGHTTLTSPIDTLTKKARSLFPEFVVSYYNIITDDNYGEVPIPTSETEVPSIVLPNYKRGNDRIWGDAGGDFERYCAITVNSIPVTNLPISEVLGQTDEVKAYSTSNGELMWRDFWDPIFGRVDYPAQSAETAMYPEAKISGVEAGEEVSGNASRKLLVVIKPSLNDTIFRDDALLSYDEDYTTRFADLDVNGGIIGVNTIGLYKTTVIESVEDITLKSHDESSDTYSEVIRELSGSSSELTNRDKWSVGNQFTDETSSFTEVTKLCKQGFVAGFTDRFGDVILKEIVEKTSSNVATTHDDEVIIEKSLSALSLSSISKCYNEFTVKYQYSSDAYQKELGVYNVDKSEFPSAYEATAWSSFEDTSGEYLEMFYNSGSYLILVDPVGLSQLNDDLLNNTYAAYQFEDSLYDFYTFTNPVFSKINSSGYYVYRVSKTNSSTPPIGYSTLIAYLHTEGDSFLWETYVTGYNSYSDAKSIWDSAHASWEVNKRIRSAPTDRTQLRWAVDKNYFYNTTAYDDTVEYAKSYFEMLVDWTTRQKLKISYSLPITPENLASEIMTDVRFKDSVILPVENEYGVGWVTGKTIVPKDNRIKIELTFNTDFLSGSRTPVESCSNIIEDASNTDDIIEDTSNTEDIIEGC